MTTLKTYNLEGNEAGSVEVDEAFFETNANAQLIKDYITALRANIRQWSANTKGRSEINCTKRKPFKQKGTGNARQGFLAAAQFKGGGVVFGPKPKFDQHVRINKKERRAATRHLLGDMIKQDKVLVVEDAVMSTALHEPKTKTVAQFLKKCDFVQTRTLFVGEGSVDHANFKKSVKNLPKSAFVQASNLNGYDVMAARRIVMSESALKELQNQWMGK